MRLAVLADVHANLPALEAVLRDVDAQAPDEVWVAGDLVGYNPWPNEVCEILRERHVRAIRGNHDRAILTGSLGWFTDLAAAALRWTRIVLQPGHVGYLGSLEDRTRALTPEGTVAMFHGSPRHDDEYVLPWAADDALAAMSGAPFTILGHTHLPMAHSFPSGMVVNPGSVGQPRDGDPRASWGLLDTRARDFALRRVPYDIEGVVRALDRASLPSELGRRLRAGV